MSIDRTTGPRPASDALATTRTPTELQHRASSIPGWEIVQALTEIPAGVASGWHTHPGEEVGYIIAGTVGMIIQGEPRHIQHAGDPFLIPHAPPTTRSTSAPRRAGCSPPTSSRPASR